MDQVDDYLWEVYQRVPMKKDGTADGGTLAGRSIKIGDMFHAGENPDVAILAFDADAGLVNMQQRAVAEPFQKIVVYAVVSMRNHGLKSLCRAGWDVEAK
jgi:hypothetical protein